MRKERTAILGDLYANQQYGTLTPTDILFPEHILFAAGFGQKDT